MIEWRCIFQITILFIRMLKNLLFTSLAVELKKKIVFVDSIRKWRIWKGLVTSIHGYDIVFCAIYRITDRHFKRHWEQLAIDSLILESNGVKNKNQHCIIRCSSKACCGCQTQLMEFDLIWCEIKNFMIKYCY